MGIEKTTFPEKIRDELDALEIGGTLDKKEVVGRHWHTVDEYTLLTFKVNFCKAKQFIPHKKFKTSKGIITRKS